MDFTALNVYLFNLINGLAGKNAFLDMSMIFSAKYLVFSVILLLLYLWFVRGGNDEDRKMSILVFLSMLLSLAAAMAISSVYYHPRPFAMGLGTTLIHKAPDSSFPSDHTTVMFASSFPLIFFRKYWKEGGLFLLLALLVGFSRIFCGVHFPFDIAGSFFVALSVGTLLFLLKARLFPLFSFPISWYDKIVGYILRSG